MTEITINPLDPSIYSHFGEIHSHNTFEQSEAIQPAPFDVTATGSRFTVALPAASVAAVEIELG